MEKVMNLLNSLFTPVAEWYARWWVNVYFSLLDSDQVSLGEIYLVARRLSLFPKAGIRAAFEHLRREDPFYEAIYLVLALLTMHEPKAAEQLIPELDAWFASAGPNDAPPDFLAALVSLVCFVNTPRETKGPFLVRALTAVPTVGTVIAPLLAHYTRTGDSWVELIELQLTSGKKLARHGASQAFALMQTAVPEVYTTLADQAVNAPDATVRANSVRALDRFGTPEAETVITTCLNFDKALFVRNAAAEVLRKTDATVASLVVPLLKVVPGSQQDEIDCAYRFTASFGMPALTALFEALDEDLPNGVKAYVISFIHGITTTLETSDEGDVQKLITGQTTTLLHCLDWAPPSVARRIYELLVRVDCFEAVLTVVRSGSSPGASLRCADLFLILLSQDYNLLDRLIELTNDENADLRVGALFTIIDSPDLRITAAAHKAFEDKDVRMQCLAAYRFVGDRSLGTNAVEMLLEYMRLDDPLMSRWAVALMRRAFF
jgi:HEAT repeat protein